ncbi:MAG: tRNA dihydrouridine synthase DusB [Desulfobacteraceae bacterium]|nr:tRNA dihydrouridine synthase DusB [Desulfobacteraceae bacterium]
MKIGDLEIKGRTVLAPLAGITNLPFRLIAKECGCALVCSEMVSAKGLQFNSQKTKKLMEIDPGEHPVSIQIFGAEADCMARAASYIDAEVDADIIDINFGCSVKKVAKTGAGVALMKDFDNAREIIRAVRKATSIPFTIKIRSGWDSSAAQAFDIARMAEDNGVDAIAIHPRTAGQGFRGRADWRVIKQLKQMLSIPVIGNGDVTTPEEGLAMVEETGCDAVMVGRAAMGDPFIFAGIEALLRGEPWSEPSIRERFAVMERMVDSHVEYLGERVACRMMRSRLSWFVKGLAGASVFRRELTGIESRDHAISLIRGYGAGLVG